MVDFESIKGRHSWLTIQGRDVIKRSRSSLLMVMVSNLEEEILWKGVNLGINVIILVVPLCKYKSSCIPNNNDASDSTEITVCNCIRLQEVEFCALALLSTRRPYNYCSNSFPTRRPTTVHRYRSHSLSDCLRIPLQLN